MTMSHYEPNDHPDLKSLDEHIRHEFDDVLTAEQYAARISAQRRMTLRDRLVRAEDLECDIAIRTTEGTVTGTLTAVGTDHVLVGGRSVIAIAHIICFELTG